MHKNSVVKLFKKFKGKVYKLLFDLEDYIKYSSKGLNLITINKQDERVRVRTSRNGYIHCVIMKHTDPNMVVDHKDRNPLNNRKSNLRIATRSQNMANRDVFNRPDMPSRYKGVTFHDYGPYNREKKWLATIVMNRKKMKKYFLTEMEAAKQYNKWAKELHGEFAVLNDV